MSDPRATARGSVFWWGGLLGGDGAYRTIQYAEKQGKKIVNIADEN